MSFFAIAVTAIVLGGDTVTLREQIDLFDPSTGGFLGTERTWFSSDGRRLREEITDASGTQSLLYLVLHDGVGREAGAIYVEDGSEELSREVFSYSPDGRVRTTTYYYEPGVASDRTIAELDEAGREIRKRYYRSDGSAYGEEDVLWDDNGNQLGWDFRYVDRVGGASFRYAYEAFDTEGRWVRRIRSRDGTPQRLEVRSRITASKGTGLTTPARFLPDRISTQRSETSPSFSQNGKIMVFARYDGDWTRKDPYIAYLEPDGWRVEPLHGIGPVYNLAISPDGKTVLFSIRSDRDARALFRIRHVEGGWSTPENLTERYGLVGTYPCLTENGDLFFFDASGTSGAGIYLARREGDGFAAPTPAYVPQDGTPFDGYAKDTSGILLVSRCFDDTCESGGMNGIWEVRLDGSRALEARRLPGLPYSWGVQPVDSLGLLVFTDGEDILAVPLTSSGMTRD